MSDEIISAVVDIATSNVGSGSSSSSGGMDQVMVFFIILFAVCFGLVFGCVKVYEFFYPPPPPPPPIEKVMKPHTKTEKVAEKIGSKTKEAAVGFVKGLLN